MKKIVNLNSRACPKPPEPPKGAVTCIPYDANASVYPGCVFFINKSGTILAPSDLFTQPQGEFIYALFGVEMASSGLLVIEVTHMSYISAASLPYHQPDSADKITVVHAVQSLPGRGLKAAANMPSSPATWNAIAGDVEAVVSRGVVFRPAYSVVVTADLQLLSQTTPRWTIVNKGSLAADVASYCVVKNDPAVDPLGATIQASESPLGIVDLTQSNGVLLPATVKIAASGKEYLATVDMNGPALIQKAGPTTNVLIWLVWWRRNGRGSLYTGLQMQGSVGDPATGLGQSASLSLCTYE